MIQKMSHRTWCWIILSGERRSADRVTGHLRLVTYVVTGHDRTALVWEITCSSNINISVGSKKTFWSKRHILDEWKPKPHLCKGIKSPERDICQNRGRQSRITYCRLEEISTFPFHISWSVWIQFSINAVGRWDFEKTVRVKTVFNLKAWIIIYLDDYICYSMFVKARKAQFIMLKICWIQTYVYRDY
jgi:hypothetical protein